MNFVFRIRNIHSMIQRYSSLRDRLGDDYLKNRLQGARSYDRIAGYFSSSLLEVAGEALESISGPIRVVCNSELSPEDVQSARYAAMAMGKEWKQFADSILDKSGPERFVQLAQWLHSGKINVRVLPNESFGLVHGKAGVITRSDGTKTGFIGSVNESMNGWKRNYELLWEDDSNEAVEWVQNEFNVLWNHPTAKPLAQVVVDDVERIAKRKIVGLAAWKKSEQPGAAVVETPVYRKEFGLWAHQKYFIDLAYRDHISGKGARYVLADMVGLGKTVQLALSAQLMALWGDKPVLVIAPKTLVWQWQDELRELLDIPSAVWDGKQWVDEQGVAHPSANRTDAFRQCPRTFGIVSQGLIISGSEIVKGLLALNFECVIVDECHRARRKNLKKEGEDEPAEPNNLLKFIQELAPKTISLLLATATPVQIYPIEAYDLLYTLNLGNDHVLGNKHSRWNAKRKQLFQWVMGKEEPRLEDDILLEYLRNPLPPAIEDERSFGWVRRNHDIPDSQAVLSLKELERLSPREREKLLDKGPTLFTQHNPFIRHIIRRTRTFLENELDPETHEPYLDKVEVRLFGEEDSEAILLEGTLLDAYQSAEAFCRVLGKRVKASGFMKTLLLKRLGSSIQAGKNSCEKLLLKNSENWEDSEEEESGSSLAPLTPEEHSLLSKTLLHLEQFSDYDPKYIQVKKILDHGVESDSTPWKEYGCILFSQYLDTAHYMAQRYAQEHPDIPVGLYSGGDKSGVFRGADWVRQGKDWLKSQVRQGTIKVLFGTDAASEGLNLQRLGTLINIDLPWNPTRLEQRKGRIQRIGQKRPEVYVYNMRYKDSVEDRVHGLLSERLKGIHDMFGQIPDVLEDAWIDLALGEKEEALKLIHSIPIEHPFEIRYNRIANVPWERYSTVLNNLDRKEKLVKPWS